MDRLHGSQEIPSILSSVRVTPLVLPADIPARRYRIELCRKRTFEVVFRGGVGSRGLYAGIQYLPLSSPPSTLNIQRAALRIHRRFQRRQTTSNMSGLGMSIANDSRFSTREHMSKVRIVY